MLAYGSMFLSAFLAATILPVYSEAVLIGFLTEDTLNPWILLVVASIGNTLGSVVNWALGLWCLHFQDRRWFPVSQRALVKAQDRFQRWGLWSLLLSWAPFIGDPLTFAAGIMRVRFIIFLPLVLLAKTGRYLFILLIALKIIA
ncbi:YqaA family protein [Aestuariispira insulae]|uniref:Membrane protein YqaA with SNARE-associated domain n=1 Tax=Aestuariispira insulae TaxID=1461337 RepID=A0A3D9HDW3_9PROT|nr:YqaA family protein [Aestuariispira insulae]RED47662.1 membrane protein YqaA with SNARE-associated domain [Aestuariispira insulae]